VRPSPLIASLPVLVLAAVLGPLALPGPAAASESASNARQSRVVVSPHRGQVVRSHRPRVRVRAPMRMRGVQSEGGLRVRLNGTRIGGDFGRPHKGIRSLRTSMSHGLRHGRNVLRVRVLRRDGSVRRAKVRFIVRPKGPLVGAGRNRRVPVGATIRLGGAFAPARRFGHRTSASAGVAAKPRRPRVRWTIVRQPRRHRRAQTVTGARGTAKARLKSPASLNAGVKPARPGRYMLQLTAGRGDDATSDIVTFEAVPPKPLVPIDTKAGDDENPGIKIGDTLYPADTSKGPGLIQVVVLDRSSLALRSNTTYAFGDRRLPAAVSKLDHSSLVVAAQPNPTNPDRGNAILDALAGIGAPLPAKIENSYRVSAVIGVPGMKRGDADAGMNRIGGLKGYLTPDQFSEYGFVAARREPFNYPTDPQPPCKSGGAVPCDGRAGFTIRIRNEFTLEPQLYDRSFYNTNGRDLTDDQRKAEADRMARAINDIVANYNNDSLVTIETVTSRFEGEDRYRAPIGPLNGSSMNNLAQAVASVGGTRDAFNRVTTKGGSPESGGHVYTLVGWSGAGEGNGAEAAAGVNGTPDAPELSGVLRPDHQSRLRPEAVSTQGGDPNALANKVMQPPSHDWPHDGEPGVRKAISYLGSQIKQLGPDPRLAYPTADWDQSDTTAFADKLGRVSYPGDGKGFTRAAFEVAREQLITELGQVGTVRSYMKKLAAPFDDNQLKSYSAAHVIADDIFEATHKPKDETTYRWLEFTKILLELAAPFTEDVTGEMAGLMDLGMWVAGATAGGESTYDDFAIKANQLGDNLIDQLSQTAATYDRLGDIIVSDPKKLAYFGEYGGCNPVGNDKCPRELAWGKAQKQGASADVYRGIERALYQKLMPLGYRVVQLNPSNMGGERPGIGYNWITRRSPPNIASYACNPNPGWSATYHPWSNYPAESAAATFPVMEFDPSIGTSVYLPYVMTEIPAASWQHGEPPPEELLERMFGPLPPGNNPKEDGLGISPQVFMADAPLHYWEDSFQNERNRCIWDR
jgi:hypothetical protein